MIVKVQKQGNELFIPIPDEIVQKLKLTENIKLKLLIAEELLIIKRAPQFTLEELLEGITPENKHDEIDFGPSLGNEVW